MDLHSREVREGSAYKFERKAVAMLTMANSYSPSLPVKTQVCRETMC